MDILFFTVAFLSSIVGAICGIGGGVVIKPVLDMLQEIEAMIQFENGILNILLKCTGIALITEIAALICQDAGSGSLGKMVHFMGTSVILYLSVPAITALMKMLREMIGGL